jgi:hypothetical protein
MKLIKPITINDSRFISSTVAEPASGETAWVSGTTYAQGNLRIRTQTHRIYKRLVAGAGTTPPENDPTNWEDFAPTNRWAMFDNEVNTQTSGNSPLTVTIAPGAINSLALIELLGTSVTVTVTDGAGGPTVFTTTVNLEQSSVSDWYQYFFEPFSQKGTLILTGIPPYSTSRVTITVTGSNPVKCGGFIVGTVYDLGGTQYGVTAGIRDYSKKETDSATGVVTLVPGRFSKRLRAKLQVNSRVVAAQIQTLLTELRATPVVWIGDDTGEFEPLTVFGFYRDFELDVSYPTVSHYSLDIEGMT